jgi:hypothetical protein
MAVIVLHPHPIMAMVIMAVIVLHLQAMAVIVLQAMAVNPVKFFLGL